MKLDFNLQVTQKQGIALTAQVQQAIKLLHMTNMEIQEYVDDKFQDNPFIETKGEFEEQKQSEITKNNRADICLLYTSPSPRDQRGSRMPSSA